LAIAIKFAFFTKAKPKKYRGIKIEEFPRFFATLLAQAEDGGKVVFTHEKSGTNFTFEKQGGEHEEYLSFQGNHEELHVDNIEEAMVLIDSFGFQADDSFSMLFDYLPYFDIKLTAFKMAKYQQYLNPAGQRLKADEK
jgi:hypothetical protein